jgi:Antibiotic biosynthesis monooxygenase
MFAAIRRYELGAGSVADLIRIVDEGLAATLSREPGFVGYELVEGEGQTIVSVSLFEDEQSTVRSNAIAAEFVRDRLQPFQLNLISAMDGEVGVSRTGSDAARG